jgi:DNA-binding winged helix-turn-helix (wHTH) protein/TolB-like protein/Flp pilus assembly protein TadD
MRNAVKHLYAFGPFRLDPAERLLLRDGQPVPLTPKTFDTLVALVERSGHLVDKQNLLKLIWPDSFVEEGNLCVTVSMLRKALGSDREERKYIETVSKCGYRFVAPVTELEEEPIRTPTILSPEPDQITKPEPIIPQPHPTTQAISRLSARKFPSGRTATWILLLVLLAGAGATLVIGRITSKGRTPSLPSGSLPVRSLAVLPFQTLGAKSGDEYLGFAMADALTTKLGSTGKIVMRPSSSMQKYPGSLRDPQSVGREQGVDAVLDGRIQRAGDRLRLTVQLVRVVDGTALWADTIDTTFTNIFAVEDTVSEQVARSIRLELTGEEKKLLTKRFTENREANLAYVKGRYFWSKRTEGGLKKGFNYFQQAVALDPAYAQAYVGVADSYAMLGLYTVLPPKEAFPKAKEAAMKALEIGNGLAEAHATLGFVGLYYDWDGSAAEKELQRALQSNPNYPMAHSWRGQTLAAMGRFPEAMADARQAQEADPLSPIIHTNAGWVFFLAGQNNAAIQSYERAIEIDPNFPRAHYRLGNSYVQNTIYPQAIIEFQKAVRLSGGDPYYTASLGYAYAVSGKAREAREVLAQLKQRSRLQYVPAYALALIYTGLADKDQAFEWFERAVEDRSTSMAYLRVEPALNSLRSDPRFAALARRINF